MTMIRVGGPRRAGPSPGVLSPQLIPTRGLGRENDRDSGEPISGRCGSLLRPAFFPGCVTPNVREGNRSGGGCGEMAGVRSKCSGARSPSPAPLAHGPLDRPGLSRVDPHRPLVRGSPARGWGRRSLPSPLLWGPKPRGLRLRTKHVPSLRNDAGLPSGRSTTFSPARPVQFVGGTFGTRLRHGQRFRLESVGGRTLRPLEGSAYTGWAHGHDFKTVSSTRSACTSSGGATPGPKNKEMRVEGRKAAPVAAAVVDSGCFT